MCGVISRALEVSANRSNGSSSESGKRAGGAAVSATQSGDPVLDEEDVLATATAAYVVLLAAHGRGLAGYWRTQGVLRTRRGAEAVGLGPDERFVALIHLGRCVQEKPAPDRVPASSVVSYLD